MQCVTGWGSFFLSLTWRAYWILSKGSYKNSFTYAAVDASRKEHFLLHMLIFGNPRLSSFALGAGGSLQVKDNLGVSNPQLQGERVFFLLHTNDGVVTAC